MFLDIRFVAVVHPNEDFGGRLHQKKMRQAGVYACLIIRCSQLEVELQGKLDISRRLRSRDDARVRLIDSRVRSGKVDAVERIQEVGTELQSESFCELEVFL